MGLDGEFQRVGIRGLFGNHRGSVGASDLDVDRRAGDARNPCNWKAPGVVEQEGIKANCKSGDAESLGYFLQKGEEKFGGLVVEIFDRIERFIVGKKFLLTEMVRKEILQGMVSKR